MSKNKEKDKLENLDYEETPRTIMVEKLIMNEYLNSQDFLTLLETTAEEFKRTFAIETKFADVEEEKFIE